MSLTPKQAAILRFLETRIQQDGYAPTFEEIAREFGFRSLSTVSEHVKHLADKGYVRKGFKTARDLTLVDQDNVIVGRVVSRRASNGFLRVGTQLCSVTDLMVALTGGTR